MKTVLLTCVLFFCSPLFVLGASIIVTPEQPTQGDPVLVVIEGVDSKTVQTLTFAGKTINTFLYQSKTTALVGIDLTQQVGAYNFVLNLKSGEKLEKTITVLARKKVVAPLGIPQKLGGNTKVAQSNLVTTLTKENAVLAKAGAALLPFWSQSFTFPLKDATVIDAYGYSRSTGSYFIAHKGTDFRAATGIPILAINTGVVRLAREFTVYGKTVAIDHGGTVLSLSMHLSKINVKVGQKVQRGDVIGFSGDSGYALGPHLHLSIRIAGVSIDPMKFFALFETRF